jgi:hypothetical protein
MQPAPHLLGLLVRQAVQQGGDHALLAVARALVLQRRHHAREVVLV